ncbi:MAG: LPS assembly protein LptD, partial [Steroidobacter sp.]
RWNYTAYWLAPNSLYLDGFSNAPNSRPLDRKPVISAPTTSLDMAMIFEKSSWDDQRLYTLQPRLLYLNTLYRKQTDIPVFDTGLPDFNLVQLFRTERFVGPDRLGDSDQLSAGITARMINSHSGRQILLGTLGQAFYFKSPCVTSLTSDSCDPNAPHSSPLIGQVTLSAFKNWNATMGIQWDPIRSRSERSELNFQYRPDSNRVVNLSYRYSRATSSQLNSSSSGNTTTDRIDQLETSFAWPVGINWSTYGRVVYSRLDNALHDYLGGIEYRSCCWNLRLVVGRSIATRDGSYDNRVSLQFEFKGLGSAGTADTFLQSAIPGFSARQPRGN